MHFDHESVIKDNCISPRMLKKVIFIKNGWLFENKLILHNNKKNSRKTAFNVLTTKKWAMLQLWGKRWIVENYFKSPKLIFKKIFSFIVLKHEFSSLLSRSASLCPASNQTRQKEKDKKKWGSTRQDAHRQHRCCLDTPDSIRIATSSSASPTHHLLECYRYKKYIRYHENYQWNRYSVYLRDMAHK